MGKMNKPEKKPFVSIGRTTDGFICGYNQACDDWEKYHRQEIKIAIDHIERLEKQLEIKR